MTIINGYLEFVSPNTSPKTIRYIECRDLSRILNRLEQIPRYYLQGGSYYSASYYSKPDSDHVAGSGTLNHFLKAPEIVEYLLQFPKFAEYCACNNIDWFLRSSVVVKVSKCINKHYFVKLGNNKLLKDFV